MKFRFAALNGLLVVAIVAIVFQARSRVEEARARREANLNTATKPVVLPPVAPAAKPEAAPAAKYADIANKDLFVKDRNPVVIVDAPKVEPPKPMPPLPVVYGVMGLPSGTKAIMAKQRTDPAVPVHAGDTVGEFTIVSLDTQNVTFRWGDQEVSRKIEDLMDRSAPAQPETIGGARSLGPSPPPAISAAQAQAQIQIPSQNRVQSNNVPPTASAIGVELGASGQSERACTPGDNSAPGTVVNGYRKTITATPFGALCRWMPAQ